MSSLVDAWQGALAAEQEAAFGYGLLGPRLTAAQHAFAYACFQVHETTRDTTRAAIAVAGLTPTPPLPDYPALYPVADAAAARRLAVRLEDGTAAAWRYLYAQAAATTGAQATKLRGTALAELTASAVRATRWRALIDPAKATTPFPGI